MDNIRTWTGLPVEESIRMTEDRDKWRKYVHGVADLRIEDSYRAEQNILVEWFVLSARNCCCQEALADRGRSGEQANAGRAYRAPRRRDDDNTGWSLTRA